MNTSVAKINLTTIQLSFTKNSKVIDHNSIRIFTKKLRIISIIIFKKALTLNERIKKALFYKKL